MLLVLSTIVDLTTVNDICDIIPIEVTVKLFADDTKIYSTLSDDMSVECLQACLHATCISSWSDHWQLTLSPSKCTVLHVVAADKCRAPFSYSIAAWPHPTCGGICY